MLPVNHNYVRERRESIVKERMKREPVWGGEKKQLTNKIEYDLRPTSFFDHNGFTQFQNLQRCEWSWKVTI